MGRENVVGCKNYVGGSEIIFVGMGEGVSREYIVKGSEIVGYHRPGKMPTPKPFGKTRPPLNHPIYLNLFTLTTSTPLVLGIFH